MSALWIECSSSAPPPACARSDRHELCPGTTSPVGQYWSSRSVYPIGAPSSFVAHEPHELVDQRVEARMESDLRGQSRRGDERAHLGHDVEARRQRLLAQQRLARGDDGLHEIAVRRRGGDDHDRVDVGIVDDGLGVGCDALERADGPGRYRRFGREVGHRDGTHLAVLGQQPQRVRMALADHPGADQSDPDWLRHSGMLTRSCRARSNVRVTHR